MRKIPSNLKYTCIFNNKRGTGDLEADIEQVEHKRFRTVEEMLEWVEPRLRETPNPFTFLNVFGENLDYDFDAEEK